MKQIVVFALLALSPLVLSGELQQLHQSLTRSETSVPPNVAPQKSTVPGTTLAPGLPLGLPRADHGITEIGLERLRCLAGCPAYTLIVEADGSFHYVGEYGVERLGEYTGTVNQGRLNQVLAFIAEADFDNFESSYLSPFLDGPTVYTMVRQGDDVKVVENYAGRGPATLWAIEQLVDSLLPTAEWRQADTAR